MTYATVPAGHQVAIHGATSLPGVARSGAGVWLAHQGVSSDALDAELDALLDDVETTVRGVRSDILLANTAGPLFSLFAPAEVALIPLSGLLVWVLDADALGGASRGPALVQQLLRRLHQIRTRSAPPLAQTVFVLNGTSPRGRAVAELVLGLDLPVRTPDPFKSVVLTEVHRPEGIILSVLAGKLYVPTGVVDVYPRTVNEEKDRAERAGDHEQLRRLEEQERGALAERFAPVGGEPKVSLVERAPRLRRLLLAVDVEGDAAREALYEELIRRQIPLLVIVDPKTRGAALRRWSADFEALPVYADQASLVQTAREVNLAPDSFAAATMPPKALFTWAASKGWPVAMQVYRETNEPVYVPLAAEVVRALARGEMPARRDRGE